MAYRGEARPDPVTAEAGKNHADAVEVGAILREARLALERSVEDVAADLIIRPNHISAIEDGRLRDLPGPVFGAGFVRAYGDYLGLDGGALAGSLKTVPDDDSKGPDLSPPVPMPERRLPTAPLLLISAGLALVAYGGWYFTVGSEGEPVEAVAVLPDEISEAIAPPQAGAPEDAAPEPPASTTVLDAAPPPRETAPSGSAGPEKVVAPAEAEPEGRRNAAPASIVLRARADSWLEVGAAGSEPVFSGLLREGDSYRLPETPGLTLTTGNAAGLDILIGDRLVGDLGPRGTVLRGIPLDADRLLPPETN